MSSEYCCELDDVKLELISRFLLNLLIKFEFGLVQLVVVGVGKVVVGVEYPLFVARSH